MATVPAIVSLEEYLHTEYSPDCEYIDGTIVERNVGKGKHSYTQSELLVRLRQILSAPGKVVLVEQRTRVSESRVRIPDVCVVSKLEEVTTKAPLLCVEVLSPDDRWNRVHASIADYQAMGVPCVWVVDPYERRAWVFDEVEPPSEVRDGVLRAPLSVELPLSDVLPPE
ncbi:MAG: Uma2 family endonuclease [Acidobacteriaceae bacterium]|nr:Uma2 family endonuclease [Acidobacteriaceae bacterium]